MVTDHGPKLGQVLRVLSKYSVSQLVWFILPHYSKPTSIKGPHFLCWISEVVPFNTWPISSWEANKCCYKLSKCPKWHLFHSKWSNLSFWVKIAVIMSVAQLVTTLILFSAWDKSCDKWDNFRNSTQKKRTSIYNIVIGVVEFSSRGYKIGKFKITALLKTSQNYGDFFYLISFLSNTD